MYNQSKDKIGKIFNDFIVESYNRCDNKHTWFNCRCLKCGRIKIIRNDGLKKSTKHELCIKLTPNDIYKKKILYTLSSMKDRCSNQNNQNAKWYYDKGISCEYENTIDFYDDFIDSLIKHCLEYGIENTSIDRIDSSKGYYKENLKWSTPLEQSRNTSLNKRLIVSNKENGFILDGSCCSEVCETLPFSSQQVSDVIRGKQKNLKQWNLIYYGV